MTKPLLQTKNLSKEFGGVHAVRNVSLQFHANQTHAIIGPNGGGKTTLINLLSGEISPSRGHVQFNTTNITGATPDSISRLGIGRSYQQIHVIGDMTCRENCSLGARGANRDIGFIRSAKQYYKTLERADEVLRYVGLIDRAETLAGRLSHGEQRQLEIGMVLAASPELVLLDEPLAGMGASDTRRMIDLLKKISQNCTIILIEHDMNAVFELADILTVMVEGEVIMTGTPKDVRSAPKVQRAYLGVEA